MIITGTIHEDQFTFLILFRLVLFTVRNIPDNTSIGNQYTFCFQYIYIYIYIYIY